MPTEQFDPPRARKDGRPKRKPGRPPGDRKQRIAIEKIGRMAGDIERLIDDQIRMCEWTQGAVRHEITSREGAKQEFIHPDDIGKLHALTKMIGELVSAKSKFSHLAKFLGAGLTPEEVLEAAVQRILRLDTRRRGEVVKRLAEEHEARKRVGTFTLPVTVDVAADEPTTPQPPVPPADRPQTALDAIVSLEP